MKAAVLKAPRAIEIIELPIPEITPGKCLVRVKACGICGADRVAWERGPQGTAESATFGHEAVGVIEQKGAGVARWRVGDRVAIYNVIGCGRCRHCLRGEEKYCLTQSVVGQGFCEYALVPQENLLPLPDWLDFVPGTLATDVAGTALRAVRLAHVPPNAIVGVWGLGPLCLIFGRGAKRWGSR